MRLFKIICLCIIANFTFGQKKPISVSDNAAVKDSYKKGYKLGSGTSESEKGLEIFHGWKVKYDDNINYSKVGFDDSKWDTTSTDNNIKNFQTLIKTALVGSEKRF